MALRFSLAVLAAAAACCLSPSSPRESLWPPPDYYLEVRLHQGQRESKRARFWADGLAVYSEASDWLGGAAADTGWLPVFGVVAAYQMREPSIRDLSRLLGRAGLLELEPEQSSPAPDAPLVTVHWRAFGGSGTVWAEERVEGPMARVLQVINAFLPAGRGFVLEGMAGDPEPPHLARLPEPQASVAGALEFYQAELLARHPDDAGLLLDVFGLALGAGEYDVAERVMQRLEQREEPDAVTALDILPGMPPTDLPTQLRALLQQARGG